MDHDSPRGFREVKKRGHTTVLNKNFTLEMWPPKDAMSTV